MATTFTIFDTTPTNVVSDIKTAILVSTDWSNPASNRVTATTTDGASMVVDLADAAATNTCMQFGVYRTTGLADKVVRYLPWRASGGASGDVLHVTLSAGKDHLYFSIEGPRPGEANAVNSSEGSDKTSFFLGAIAPYFTADTVPAVCLVAHTGSTSRTSTVCWVSRDAADSSSWVQARLASICPVLVSNNNMTQRVHSVQRNNIDSSYSLFPYVVFEDVGGMRGRLQEVFFAGGNLDGGDTTVVDPAPSVYRKVSYDSKTYIHVIPNKGQEGSGGNYQPWGMVDNDAGPPYGSPVIVVPYS